MISPSILPETPTTNFPFTFIDPVNEPSIRMSPFVVISPSMIVPAPIKFTDGLSAVLFFAILLNILMVFGSFLDKTNLF
jgi:hypothetical protein